MFSDASHVGFSGRVREELPEEIQRRLEIELPKAFRQLATESAPRLFVPRLFSGYTPDFAVKIVLAVEVTHADGYERHIVKVGSRKEVERDFNGWKACTRGRLVGSRIFAPVRYVDLEEDRVAVVYRDSFALFGPDEGESIGSAPELLEDAIGWAVKDNEPDPLSAQRAISHVYSDLGVWFYRGAAENPAAAWQFYAKHLRSRQNGTLQTDVFDQWQNDSARGELRRHGVWLLCGRDQSDADPKTQPARYLDPIDFVRWAMHDVQGGRLPRTLVGRAHGDMHARNILVGIRRGEVQYPAVFDYGDMGPANVLAWDFAKLETELKVRSLALIIHNQSVADWLIERSKLRPADFEGPRASSPTINARRANRLAAFLAFEEILDEVSLGIEDEHSVERVMPLAPPPAGIQQLDRLIEILLRIRQEAAYWLGFKANRGHLWRDELYFSLAVYGLLNVRWDYSVPQQEAALVSAGVALARMPSVSGLLKRAIDAGTCTADCPSYRVPLALCHTDWINKRNAQRTQLIEELVLDFKRDEENVLTHITVKEEVQHAIPLISQALLMELDAGHLHAVEPILEMMREEARTFHDFETLARVGRLYKDAADRKWESELHAGSDATSPRRMRLPSLQMYDKSFEVYAEAYLHTKNWYVGINAATLALLTGQQDLAEQYAREVAETCAAKLNHNKKERYWFFATEGEAALILNEPAVSFYESALNELSPGQSASADSSYRQAVRLWKFFADDGERRVGPVLALFESSGFRPFLKRDFLGRRAVEVA